MAMINFYCIGAQKAGTTTLHDLLKDHPDIFLPDIKEAPFFQDDKFYKKGSGWYLDRYFSLKTGEKIVGSVSPEFLFYPWVPERIRHEFGTEIKFIVILRNPLLRAISQYNMSTARELEKRDFFQAFKAEVDESDFFSLKHFSYRQRSMYAEQIERYIKIFPKKNFLFLSFEEFVKNQQAVIDKITDFLEISRMPLQSLKHSNKPFEYKIPFLNKMIFKFPYLYSSIKNYVPKQVRKSFVRLYKVEIKNNFKIEDPFLYDSIVNEYFSSDIEKTEKLTELNLKNWLEVS